jgi:PPE-repeat protein
MLKTAEGAEHAAITHAAVAAAHEAAWAGVVPPPIIAENRARLTALMSTNFMGINAPAIAATEAQYAEMWAQDATTLYTYADTLTGAVGGLTGDAALPALPTSDPAGLTSAAADAGQSAGTAGSGLTGAASQAGGMADPSSALGQVMGMAQAPMSAMQSLGSGGGGLNPGQLMSSFGQFMNPQMFGQMASGLGTGILSGAGLSPMAMTAASVAPGAGMGPVTGGMGQASLLTGSGPRMSVPSSWAEAAKAEPLRARVVSAQEMATSEEGNFAAAPRAGAAPAMMGGAGGGGAGGTSGARVGYRDGDLPRQFRAAKVTISKF